MWVSERIELREGFIEFHQVSDFADVHDVYVAVEFRSQGYGSKLMKKFLAEMKGRGIIEVTLEVRVDNTCAIGLYEKFGFKYMSVRKGYYNGVDGMLMRLELRKC